MYYLKIEFQNGIPNDVGSCLKEAVQKGSSLKGVTLSDSSEEA